MAATAAGARNQVADHIVALEIRLLDPAVRRNPDDVAGLLADSFIEFGNSGRVYTKAGILADLAAEIPRTVEAIDFETRELAPGVVQVMYRTRADGADVLRSSIWIEHGDGWLMVFHQGTKT